MDNIKIFAIGQVEAIEDGFAIKLKEEYKEGEIKIYLTSRTSMKAGMKMYDSLPRVSEKIDEVKVLEQDLARSAKELADLKNLIEKLKKVLN